MEGEASGGFKGSEEDLEEPLLSRPQGGDGGESSGLVLNGREVQGEVGACPRTCTFSGGVANLAVTAVGAGMLALPKAFATVGIASGLLLFAVVSVITYFSTSIIVR